MFLKALRNAKMVALESTLAKAIKDVENSAADIFILKGEVERLEAVKAALKLEVSDGVITTSKIKAEHRRELLNIAHERKIADEDIKHMVKMKTESSALEVAKKTTELIHEKDSEVATIKDSYRDKMETHLVKQNADTKEMYTQILAHLPKVNANLGGGWNGDEKKQSDNE